MTLISRSVSHFGSNAQPSGATGTQSDRFGGHGVAIEKGNRPASREAAPCDKADTRPRSPVRPTHRESLIDPDRLLFLQINNLRLFLDCLRKHSVNGGLIAYRVRTAAKSRWSG